MSDDKDDSDYVLSPTLGGGPHGVGDPDDKSLRRAETEILIPQKMKAKAKKEICSYEVKAFADCAREKGFMMPFKCRDIANQLHKCLSDAYKDQDFADKCKAEYLQERAEYRRTGVKAKMQKKDVIA